MSKIWVIGDVVVDLILDGENYYLKCVGGVLVNVVVGVVCLGCEVGFIGCVGLDLFGKFM